MSGLAVAGAFVGAFGFMLTDPDDGSAHGCFIWTICASVLLPVLFWVGVLVALASSQPVRVIIVASLITAAGLFVLDPPETGMDQRRVRRRELLAWTLLVIYACVVVWQVRVLLLSDSAVEDKIEFVAPLVGVALGFPAYFLIVEPLQRRLDLGDIGEGVLRLAVALVIGLTTQELAVRLGLIPRL